VQFRAFWDHDVAARNALGATERLNIQKGRPSDGKRQTEEEEEGQNHSMCLRRIREKNDPSDIDGSPSEKRWRCEARKKLLRIKRNLEDERHTQK